MFKLNDLLILTYSHIESYISDIIIFFLQADLHFLNSKI